MALARGSGGIRYLLRDLFTTDRAAGSVNATAAEPGPGTRAAVDTNNKITIASGVLSFATGQAANDGVWYNQITRAAGRLAMVKVTPSTGNGAPAFGLDADTTGALTDGLQFAASSLLRAVPNGGTITTIGEYAGATEYTLAAVMRATGLYWFIKGGAYTQWTLLLQTAAGTGDLYPAITAQNATSVFTADDLAVPDALWLPDPIYTDTFTRANGALGSTETAGGDGQTLTPLAWTGATWTVNTNRAINTPATLTPVAVTDGDMEAAGTAAWTGIDTPTLTKDAAKKHGGAQSLKISTDNFTDGVSGSIALTAGKWYLLSAWAYASASPRGTAYNLMGGLTRQAKILTSTNWAQVLGTAHEPDGASRPYISLMNRDGGALDLGLDDVTINELAFSELVAAVHAATPDVYQRVKIAAINSGGERTAMQAGGAVRLNAPANPTSGIIYYYDCDHIICEQLSAGTWTKLIDYTADNFTANDELILRAVGNSLTMLRKRGSAYLFAGSALTTVLTGDYAGIFSTYQTNQIEEAECFPAGTGGEHSGLDFFLSLTSPALAPHVEPGGTGAVGNMPDLAAITGDPDVETWWTAHPMNPASVNYVETIAGPDNLVDLADYGGNLQYAVDDLPETGGTIQLADNTTYPFIYIRNQSNVHIIGGTNSILRGVEITGWPTSEDYGAWNGLVLAKNFYGLYIANHRKRNFYFRDVIFDGDGVQITKYAAQQKPLNAPLFARGVVDILLDGCTIRNYTSNTEMGLVSTNGLADGIFLRGCTIGSPVQTAVYVDGGRGFGCVNCEFENTITHSVGLFFCNNDVTADFDQDGVYSNADKRTAQYGVFAGCTIHRTPSAPAIVDIIGGPMLLLNNTVDGGNEMLFRARTTYFEPPYDAAWGGEMTGQGYHALGSVLRGNEVTGTINNLAVFDGTMALPDGAKIPGQIGQYIIANNHVGTLSGVWVQEIGLVDGPNTVAGNTAG